ncbi:leukotriene A-4 hydrolase/aminopeptidase [Kwoniella shandongensis]|uniref:Leukotriene A-4 hydrolase/aminopeptidase n=1 Tax=Kwoniella shandongensis TaxID=1734106 RepID=A0A5M6BZ67_9TREE|nr:leukotriene A-4 hydrolase/aminopeptidase [Kwoniella shandongensis]KAA5527142.1 leukotriene A-4 hydrolase/aminopeptidase [Kwoniella shandongensis]
MSFSPEYCQVRERDLATLSNYLSIVTRHIEIDWTIDWTNKVFGGSASLTLEATEEGESVKEVVLDSSFLDIKDVQIDGKKVQWKLDERIEAMGEALHVTLPKALNKGDHVTITIGYSTTTQCTAVGWLEPNQTKSGKYPYLFSQCQAIHARSLLPCQDTSSVKATYNAKVRSGMGLEVLLSGLRKGVKDLGEGVREFVYEQTNALPSYLIAVAAGELVYRPFDKLDGRDWTTGVWTEPGLIEAAAWEFREDTARFVATAEDLTSAYKFGQYNVLLLPESFPYGGMENPVTTYVTPTLIAGDRSQVDVVAHEISHSWFGNGISSQSSSHFWLNEGFTTYTERLIIGKTHGEPARQLSFIIGRQGLIGDLKRFEPRFQRLVSEYKEHEDPDDGYGQCAYEKGANLLLHLERTLGGLDVFLPYIKDYVKTFEGYSINTNQWRDHLFDYFGKQEGGAEYVRRLGKVDWDAWLHGAGEDLCVDLQYDDTLAKACYELAAKWDKARDSSDFSAFSSKDLENFSATQKVVFLDKLETYETLPHKAVEALDETYGFGKTGSAEIRLRFYEIALKSGPKYAEDAAVWVINKGRMKYCRPVFRLLNEQTPELAKKTFTDHASFYHPIARKMIAKDLGVKVDL